MAFTNYYGSGTISVAANGTAVTGAGTLWSTPIVPGDTLEAGGRAVRILSVTDDTHLTLAYGWPGSTLAGSSYIIVYNSPDRNSGTYVAERARELIERQRILANGATFYVAKQVLLNTPPGSPVADDLYVVGTTPTGAWSGYAGYLAIWLGSAWGFTAPEQGWYAYAKNTDTLYVRKAASWADATGVPASQVGAANGVASLDSSGKVPSSQLPAIAITDTFVVASQSAMLALTVEVGDVAVRTDISKSFILRATPATTLGNWQELLTPTAAVSSVAGKTGAVTLVKGDVGLGNVDNTSDASKPVSTAQQAALDAKLATGTRTICIPAAAFTPRNTNPPAWGLWETPSNKRMVRSLDFDPATAEYAQVCIPMPKSWNKGYLLLWARVIWAPSDGVVGPVRWAIRAACVDYYDGTDHLDRAWGTAVANASNTSGQATATCYTDVPSIGIAGTPADNTLLFVEIYRDAADAADTYTADAKLVALYLHTNVNLPNDA